MSKSCAKDQLVAVAVVVSNEDCVVSEKSAEGLSVEDSGASVNDEAVSVV